MRIFILLVLLLFLTVHNTMAQQDSITPVREVDNIYTATAKTTHMSIDLAEPGDVELALKNIHTFRYLEAVTIEGAGNESDLRKLFYRLSVLKNMSSLTLKDNELLKVPDNIALLKNLRTLTVQGNSGLDYNDLCTHLKEVPVAQLNLIDNDIKKAPPALGELRSLKTIQITGSDQMDYTGLVEHLAKLPALTTLIIPLNYITELPKNIDQLRALQVLDVSNNNLSELPGEMSGLKTINQLSIHGNLLLNPVKDLEKLKGNNIQYLSLDKEISGEELEQIKKMFPNVHIDFPLNKEADDSEVKQAAEPAAPPVYNGELTIKKETTVLSAAYMAYPAFFQALVYNFDTLLFDERYASRLYANGAPIIPGPQRREPALYLRNYCVRYDKPGKKSETWFRFATNDQRVFSQYPELNAFGGMYWVYSGDMSKKKFYKKFLVKRARPKGTSFLGLRRFKRRMSIHWNDVRLQYEKNNNLFTVTLKCDTGFVQFSAYPVVNDIPIERSQATYYRRYELYRKALLRRAQRFNKSLARSKRNNDVLFKQLNDFAWKELQTRMSNEEKAMSKETWLKYYDDIVANEQKALDKASLASGYIARSLQLRGYSVTTSSVQVVASMRSADYYGTKNFNIDLVDAKGGGKLAVNSIFIIDSKNKTTERINGGLGLAPNNIPVKQFAARSLLLELRNGNWGFVSAAQLDKQSFEPNKVFELPVQVFDKNLDTIGDLLSSALK